MDQRILVLAFATFAVGTQAYVFAGLLEDLAADLGVPVAVAGQLASAFAITFALAAPGIAALVARFDRKRVIVCGLVALGALNLVMAAAPRFDLLMALRIGCGLASALVIPTASAAAAQLAPAALQGRALAVVLAGTTLAFVLGIPTGSAVGAAFGWRATFAYAGGLAVLAAGVIALVLPAVRPAGGARTGIRAAFNAAVLRHVALTLAAFAATFTVVAYIGPVVGLATGGGARTVGVFQMLAGVGSFIGILVGARAADRPGRIGAVAGLFAIMTLTLTGYALAVLRGPDGLGNAFLLALCVVIGAAALFAISPIVQAGLVDAAPEAGAVALALNGSALFFGQGLGAAIGGVAIASIGYPALGLVGAGLAALAGAAVLAAFPQGRPARRLA